MVKTSQDLARALFSLRSTSISTSVVNTVNFFFRDRHSNLNFATGFRHIRIALNGLKLILSKSILLNVIIDGP